MKGLNSRIIKVPVFRTKIEEEEINLFSIDREEMVRQACKKLTISIVLTIIRLYWKIVVKITQARSLK